jgi:hypothetical protein
MMMRHVKHVKFDVEVSHIGGLLREKARYKANIDPQE